MGGLSRGERLSALVPTRAAGGLGSVMVDSAAYGAHLASVVSASGTELHQRHGVPSSFGSAAGVACRPAGGLRPQVAGKFYAITCNGGRRKLCRAWWRASASLIRSLTEF